MKTKLPAIYRSLEEVSGGFGPCALTIGNFDGVHAGHRRILRRVVELARKMNWRASAMTFDPHPARILAPAQAPRLLTTPEERARLMGEEGIEQVLILPFTAALSRMAPEEFVRDLLVGRLDVRAVLVGADFRFGYQKQGDTRLLAKLGEAFGFRTEVIEAVKLAGLPVSSSLIRKLIENGEVSRARRMLERPYWLEGEVIKGFGIGSTQTVPTLNLRPPAEVLPAAGVYVTQVEDSETGRQWPAVTNVGFRPTFGGTDLSIESHLLEPLEVAPPRRLRVEFLYRLRPERKFASAEQLKIQIMKDIRRAGSYFRRLRRLLYSKRTTGF